MSDRESVFTFFDATSTGLWWLSAGVYGVLFAKGVIDWIRYLGGDVELDDLSRLQVLSMCCLMGTVVVVLTVAILSAVGYATHYLAEMISK